MRRIRPGAAVVRPVLAVIVLLVVIVVLGVFHPVRPAVVSTDSLGPAGGELVADYLVRASRSLERSGVPGDRFERTGGLEQPGGLEQHWALVSFDQPVTTEAVQTVAAHVRVSQLLFRVPLDRVQTPLVPVSVAAGDAAIGRASQLAAGRVQEMTVGTDRQAQIAAVSSARLVQNCPCVIGLLVRADLDRLSELQSASGVRAVEALTADAVFGRFAVRPLLPEQVEVVSPGPDDGLVPEGGE